MRKHILISIITCLSAMFPSISLAANFEIKRLGMEDGLSSNYVTDVSQDRKGYIWIATGSGINRFDGNSFKIYNHKNSNLTDSDISNVLGDPFRDNVWISVIRKGLFCFDYDTEKFMPIYAGEDFKGATSITNMTMASDSGIWITDSNKGVFHFKPSLNTVSSYDSNNVNGLPSSFTAAADDGMGNLYVGHTKNGLSIISLKDRSVKRYVHEENDPESLPGDYVRCILIDRDQNVWVGTDSGLALLNGQSGKFTRFRHIADKENSLLSDQIFDIRQMSDGTIWIGTNMGGVSILNLKENAFITPENIVFNNIRATNDRYGLSGPNVRSLIEDSFGNIWIGNYRGGLDFISNMPPAFYVQPFNTEDRKSLNYKQVWGINVSADNNLWMCGEGEIAVFDDMKKVRTFPLASYGAMPNTHVHILYTDSKGNIWMGTYKNGILKYSKDSATVIRLGLNIHSELDVCCFYEDADGRMWIGTQTGVFSCLNDKLQRESLINSSMSNLMIHGICRDMNGNMWFATFGDGIYIFDKSNNMTAHIISDKGFSSNAVSHLYKDKKGRMITATRNGIAIFGNTDDPTDYKVFDAANNLLNINVRAVQEDLDGNLWISTNGGISRLDEKEELFYNYTHYDGVPIGDFMDGSACIDNGGTIYFGSQNGVCYFNPRQLATTINISPVRITELCTYGRKTESRDDETAYPVESSGIELPHDINTFRISFNILDYTQNKWAEYEYMLEGLEKAWYNTHGENQVIFRNLPPGKYTFRVRARIRNQKWSTHQASISINIARPWWSSLYARVLYLIIISLSVYTLLKFYKRKVDLESSLETERKRISDVQELNDERIRFYTNITHELRTPLTLILSPLEDLLCDKNLSPKHINRISIVHDSASRLLNLINSILEFRKTETQNRKLAVIRDCPATLIYEIGLKYKELNPNCNVEYDIVIEDKDTLIYYDTEILTTILDNLLSNAAKYTPHGTITLSYRLITDMDVQYAEIEVADTGYGISGDAISHIFDRYYQANGKHQASGSGIGLAIVKGLCELHETTIDVSSNPGEGTRFTIRMLVHNNYPNALHDEEKFSRPQKNIPSDNNPETSAAAEVRPILLITEDNTELRNYMETYFSEFFEVITAVDGSQGVEIAQNRIPNIIVSDIMMPVMDGIEMCRSIKEDIRTSHIPVILLTAKNSFVDKETGYSAGADSYLTKPFSAKLLHSRINNLLEMRKKIAASFDLNNNDTHKQTEQVPILNPLDNRFISKINSIIEEHLDMQKMDVSFIADKMCMSQSTLYRKIKGLTDMSSNEYIRKIKLNSGAKLLLENRYTISEISYMTGFSSVAYFRQCFKDEFDMAPTEYIRSRSSVQIYSEKNSE